MARITDAESCSGYLLAIEATQSERVLRKGIKGSTMFRIMSIATLVMIAVCFFIGASLAFADEGPVDATYGTEQGDDASRPVENQFDENLAERDQDHYDFSDYLKGTVREPAVDAESIEEPEIDRKETVAL